MLLQLLLCNCQTPDLECFAVSLTIAPLRFIEQASEPYAELELSEKPS